MSTSRKILAVALLLVVVAVATTLGRHLVRDDDPAEPVQIETRMQGAADTRPQQRLSVQELHAQVEAFVNQINENITTIQEQTRANVRLTLQKNNQGQDIDTLLNFLPEITGASMPDGNTVTLSYAYRKLTADEIRKAAGERLETETGANLRLHNCKQIHLNFPENGHSIPRSVGAD